MNKYSHVSVMGAYINTIRFALDNLEMYLDELGDDILYDNMSSFPEDVLGDDSLFAGYNDPWSPDDEPDEFGSFYTPAQAGCDCDDCLCNKGESKKEYFDWIEDVLRKSRQSPQDYRMD